MDTSNDEEVVIIKNKPTTRKPKSEKPSNPQQTEHPEKQAQTIQNEPTSKAKTTTTSRAKKVKTEQTTTTEATQDNQAAKPKAKAKAVRVRMKKVQPNQMTTQNGEEEPQQTMKIVDTIVVDI